MAITASMALGSSTTTTRSEPIVATLTVANSGGSDVTVLGVDPFATPAASTRRPLVTVAGVAEGDASIVIRIQSGDGWGNATFFLSDDGGESGLDGVPVPADGVFVDEGLALTCTFAPSFAIGEQAAFDAVLLSEVTATGTTPPTITASGTPTERCQFEIQITTGGAGGGPAKFRWSKDGGETWEESNVTVPDDDDYLLGETGITATFPASSTYATNNVYTFDAGTVSAVTTSGYARVESVPVLFGSAPIGPGLNVTVPASGSKTFSFGVLPLAPVASPPASIAYDIGANVRTSDGSVTAATVATLTCNAVVT